MAPSTLQGLLRRVGLEVGTAVGEHAPHWPVRPLEVRHDDLVQECSGGGRVVTHTGSSSRRAAIRDTPRPAPLANTQLTT